MIHILQQIQNHTFTANQALFGYLAFLLPLPMPWRLTIYNFLNSLPIPHLSPLAITLIVIFWQPILLLIIVIAFFFVFLLIKYVIPAIFSYFIRQRKIEHTFLELTFPSDTSKSAYATEQLYKLMHTVARRNTGFLMAKKTYSLEIISTRNEGIRYVIGVPKPDTDIIHRTLLSYLPGLSAKEIPDYLQNISLVTKNNKDTSSDTTNNTGALGILEFTLSDDYALPLQNQKVLGKHDSIAFITGNMTKLQKGEMIAFQIVTTPTVSNKVKTHMKQVKNTIYQGKQLSPVLFKKGILPFPLPSILIFILSPVLWLFIAVIKLIIHLPYLVFDPNGPQAKTYFTTDPKIQLQMILNPYEQELASMVKDKLADHLFETTIRFCILVNNDEEFDARQTGLTSSFSQFTSDYQSLIQKGITPIPFFSGLAINKRLKDFQERNLSGKNAILSSSELTDLYHFPNMDITKIEGLVKSKSSHLPAPNSLKQDESEIDVLVGNNTYGGEVTPVGLRKIDRKQHTYIVGKTGMGKSTIIEGMALQDIQNGKGVTVIDPHGDMVEHLLTLIPKSRQKDVIYLNPFDKAFPVGLNILSPGTDYEDVEEEHRRIAATVMSIFMKITPEKHWGQRMEHVLRNAVLTALQIPKEAGDTPYPSLYTIQRLLIDKQYRKTVTGLIPDPILKQFWSKEFSLFTTNKLGDLISPLTNKIGEFITDPLSRFILLQENSTINLSDIMNNEKILLVNLSKGNLGEERSAFFGTIIIALIQLATYSRSQIREKERKDFFVYIDEFQNFATPHFTELFSESRKYHVYFTPSHQNIAQINDPRTAMIIKGNSGNYIVLKGSSDDEKVMLPILSPEVTEGQIVNLPPHQFIMKVTNEESDDAFSGVTIPIELAGSEKVKEAIIEHSRNAYATPRETVALALKKILKISAVPAKKELKKTVKKENSVTTQARKNIGKQLKIQVA